MQFLVTGIQAAGKSTVGELLAKRFDKGAFVEGDVVWRMVVSGREEMSNHPSEEAVRQFRLRLRHGAMLATSYANAGFTAVHCDIVAGEYLEWYASIAPQARIVVLAPRADVVAARERARDKTAYRAWESVEEGVADLDRWLQDTLHIGEWIDSSDQTPDETVEEILVRVGRSDSDELEVDP